MGGLHPAAQKVVLAAMRRGWDASNIPCGKGTGKGRLHGVLLVSRSHPEVKIRIFPVRQWNNRKLASVMHRIETYGKGS